MEKSEILTTYVHLKNMKTQLQLHFTSFVVIGVSSNYGGNQGTGDSEIWKVTTILILGNFINPRQSGWGY